ncbi:unnamed protein product [Rangifer tarandus platyrhynchus]|uniref:Uncharacterized protein n=1 Tax=Rangifer tarandus platyrhynchus TaxID=3082113 RepID=A0ABN8YVP6_RANTA|nr:unnamed protein product [Rangifer tarandus platyrhynchus]
MRILCIRRLDVHRDATVNKMPTRSDLEVWNGIRPPKQPISTFCDSAKPGCTAVWGHEGGARIIRAYFLEEVETASPWIPPHGEPGERADVLLQSLCGGVLRSQEGHVSEYGFHECPFLGLWLFAAPTRCGPAPRPHSRSEGGEVWRGEGWRRCTRRPRAVLSEPGLWSVHPCVRRGCGRALCNFSGTIDLECNVNSIPLGNGMVTIIKAEISTPFLQSRKVSLRGYVIVQRRKPEKSRVRLRVQVRAESDSKATALLAGYGCQSCHFRPNRQLSVSPVALGTVPQVEMTIDKLVKPYLHPGTCTWPGRWRCRASENSTVYSNIILIVNGRGLDADRLPEGLEELGPARNGNPSHQRQARATLQLALCLPSPALLRRRRPRSLSSYIQLLLPPPHAIQKAEERQALQAEFQRLGGNCFRKGQPRGDAAGK